MSQRDGNQGTADDGALSSDLSDTREIGDFLIARGGPFYELQQRLGLLREHAFRAGPRAVLFVSLTWGVPFLLSVIEGHAFGRFEDHPFILALVSWSRYFIAVGLFMLMERPIEDRLRMYLGQFVRAPILAPDSFEPAAWAVNQALRRRDSRPAEGVCMLLAIVGTVVTFFNMTGSGVSTWAIRVSGDEHSLTLAGWWVLLRYSLIGGAGLPAGAIRLPENRTGPPPTGLSRRLESSDPF